MGACSHIPSCAAKVGEAAGHTCYGTYIRNWACYGDIQDIIACIAPRSLLIQNNVNDTWFPVSGYHRVVSEVGEVYKTLGAADYFQHQARITEHDITEEFGNRIIEWLNKYLYDKEAAS